MSTSPRICSSSSVPLNLATDASESDARIGAIDERGDGDVRIERCVQLHQFLRQSRLVAFRASSKDSAQDAEELLDLKDAPLSDAWRRHCKTLLDRRSPLSRTGRTRTDAQSRTAGTWELGGPLTRTLLLSVGNEKTHKKWSDPRAGNKLGRKGNMNRRGGL